MLEEIIAHNWEDTEFPAEEASNSPVQDPCVNHLRVKFVSSIKIIIIELTVHHVISTIKYKSTIGVK